MKATQVIIAFIEIIMANVPLKKLTWIKKIAAGLQFA